MKQVIRHDSNIREISKKNRRFVLLDTNFILTCIKQKIDFPEDIQQMGMKILVPIQTLREIKSIVNSKKKLHTKKAAELSLSLLEKTHFKEIDLKSRDVDSGIKKLKDKKIIIATLDSELKKSIPNPKLVIREKKKLEII